MESNQPFQLEPDSPDDRAAKQRAFRRVCREATAKARAAAREAGEKQVNFSLHQSFIDELDALQKRDGLRNRSQALSRILDALRANPNIKQELGL